eukprot:TRINITY_DN3535_c0_g1_i1.p2 TRINITY_DN3535_c0_g1~~TRINITY_DN3535_c0_g1_i1.p2  ORF type:complete len:259 (+),score=65.30 TRINITY_DN3535_c0_g1_i1:1824-2600(+)
MDFFNQHALPVVARAPTLKTNNPDFMGSEKKLAGATDPTTRTLNPYVTGTSVVALKYKDGVMMAADTLASYGSLSRFRNIPRMAALGDTLLGASGDISDFQYILKELEAMKEKEEYCEEDSHVHSPTAIYTWLSRVYYARRSKFNPLWNQLVIAGFKDAKPFLGTVDLLGTNYEDDHIATGYGGHLARPLLRNEHRPDMSAEEAEALLRKCMAVLFYRDCRSINKIQFSKVTAEGVTISEPVELPTSWEFKQFRQSGH